MKNILTLIAMALIIFNTSANASSANLEEELFRYNKIEKNNENMLNQVDRNINYAKKRFLGAIGNSDAGDDYLEGKFLASMIMMVEDLFDKVNTERALLDEKYEIESSDIEEIEKDLVEISDIIDAMDS